MLTFTGLPADPFVSSLICSFISVSPSSFVSLSSPSLSLSIVMSFTSITSSRVSFKDAIFDLACSLAYNEVKIIVSHTKQINTKNNVLQVCSFMLTFLNSSIQRFLFRGKVATPTFP